MTTQNLVFLKLGGSLITDKDQPLTPQHTILNQIAQEITLALTDQPDLQIVIGHGSGSFGHAVASQYQTQKGVAGAEAWSGFARVWAAARELNQIVIQHLTSAHLPVMAFPPSAGLIAADHNLQSWDLSPLTLALQHGLIPVVQGDVVFDLSIGGTIFSTEEVFAALLSVCRPQKILLAGIEPGVWQDPKNPSEIIPKITPGNFNIVLPHLSGSEAVDVTGGMLSKVQLMLQLVQQQPGLEVRVFCGANQGMIKKALSGKPVGTLINSGT